MLLLLVIPLNVLRQSPGDQAKMEVRAPIAEILGVRAGESFDEARERLAKLAEPRKEKETDDDQVAFTLHGTSYRMVVMHSSHEHVAWISAFVRDPAGIPYSAFGDLARAHVTPSLATWEVREPDRAWRVLAQGKNGRAAVVTLFSPQLPHR